MPMHNWKLVPAGIFHAFHHNWISAISNTLNAGLLPSDYYALPEQQAAGFGPDVLTLQGQKTSRADDPNATGRRGRFAFPALERGSWPSPTPSSTASKKSSVVVRHVSGDRIVSMVEIVSPGNKSSRHAFRAFIDKACELLEARIHLLIIDPFPPGPRDPSGLHAAIWEEVRDEPFQPPEDKPLTLVAYESGLTTRAYIEPVSVGDCFRGCLSFWSPMAACSFPWS